MLSKSISSKANAPSIYADPLYAYKQGQVLYIYMYTIYDALNA